MSATRVALLPPRGPAMVASRCAKYVHHGQFAVTGIDSTQQERVLTTVGRLVWVAGRSCSKEDLVAHHVAIAYPDHSRATEVIAALKRLEAEGVVELKKAAAVIRDREGALRAGEIVVQVAAGALAGAIVGVVLGLLFGALALGALIGAAAGALSGLMIGFARGDEPQNFGFGSFGQHVASSMPHGGAAVLMLVRKNDPDKAIAALQPYGGRVIHTTLPADIDAQLRTAVSQLAQAA